MMGGMMGGTGFGMFFAWVFWLLILTFVVYAVIGWVRQSGLQSSLGSATQAGETPLSILQRRYAAGEIDRTQFEAMKSQLS